MSTDYPAVPPMPSGMPGQPSQRKRRARWPWLVGVAAVIVLASAIAIPLSLTAAAEAAEREAAAEAAREAAAAEEARLAMFTDARTACGIGGMSTVTTLDGGEALEMWRVTKFDGPTYATMVCVLEELGAPASVEVAIGQTRALDGRQSDAWDGFEASWTYHPDNGASILIEHAD